MRCDHFALAAVFFNFGYAIDIRDIRRGDLIAIGRSLHVFGARDCLINSRHQLSGQRTGVSGCYALGEFLPVLMALWWWETDSNLYGAFPVKRLFGLC
jgi:hypothetical protein